MDGAGADKLMVKVAVVVPLFPSVMFTSLIVRLGGLPATQLFVDELEFRGKGVESRKSPALSLVSVQPPALRNAATVLLLSVKDAGPLPS
jgi:hypothetical protein